MASTPDQPADADADANADKPSRRFSRRKLLFGALAGVGLPITGAGYAREVEPFWVEYHDVPAPVRRLPSAFEGFRIAHLTDLHASGIVPIEFLQGVIDRVNADQPDAVFVTGDLVTNADPDWFEPAVELLAELKSPTYLTLGNHDYGRMRATANVAVKASERWTADILERMLKARGITVLRNRSTTIRRGSGEISLVGLEDVWGGYFKPLEAFSGIDFEYPVLALSHNPDTAPTLDVFGPDWIFAGHTHGGQVRFPLIGAPILPLRNSSYDQGLFTLNSSRLYVSRGVGYLRRVRFLCRPEVPTFVLQGEA